MKFLVLLLLASLLGSCSLKNALEDGGKAKTSIEPFAPSDKLADRFGDKITIKIPLGKNNLGYFDNERDVLGYDTDKLNRDERSFIGKLWDDLKLTGARLAIGAGLFNKFRISSHFNFDYLPHEYLKSAKIKRVFFTTEVCRENETNCNSKTSNGANFTFIDQLMINVEGYHDVPGDKPKEDLDAEAVNISNKEFKQLIKISETQTQSILKQKIQSFGDEVGGFDVDGDESSDRSINLLRFENLVPQMKLNVSSVPEGEKNLSLHIKDKERRKLIKTYMKSLESHVRRVSSDRDGVHLKLRKNITAQDLLEKVSADQSPVARNMIIFRMNSKQAQAKNYFNSDELSDLVKEASVVGESVYVELLNHTFRERLLNRINSKDNFRGTDLDVYRIDTCTSANCVEVKALDFNLLDILSVNPRVKLDTILSVKTLEKQDFQYNGFIEIEIVLDELQI